MHCWTCNKKTGDFFILWKTASQWPVLAEHVRADKPYQLIESTDLVHPLLSAPTGQGDSEAITNCKASQHLDEAKENDESGIRTHALSDHG
jgi:hypothetical protein